MEIDNDVLPALARRSRRAAVSQPLIDDPHKEPPQMSQVLMRCRVYRPRPSAETDDAAGPFRRARAYEPRIASDAGKLTAAVARTVTSVYISLYHTAIESYALGCAETRPRRGLRRAVRTMSWPSAGQDGGVRRARSRSDRVGQVTSPREWVCNVMKWPAKSGTAHHAQLCFAAASWETIAVEQTRRLTCASGLGSLRRFIGSA